MTLLGEAFDLAEAKRIKTGNPEHGFYGNADVPGHMSRDGVYRRTHQQIQKYVKQPAKVVQHFLDSPYGRLIATHGKSDDIEYVRNSFKQFKSRYTPELFREDDGVTDPDDLLTETSREKIQHYTNKAAQDAAYTALDSSKPHSKRLNQVNRRVQGIALAMRRLRNKDFNDHQAAMRARGETNATKSWATWEKHMKESVSRPAEPADDKKADIAGGLYTPTTKNMARFIKKMPVMRSEFGAPANQDDKVFSATNVKTYDRTKDRMGYNPGDDVKAWVEEFSDEPDSELVVMITELAQLSRTMDDETIQDQIAALLDLLSSRKAD